VATFVKKRPTNFRGFAQRGTHRILNGNVYGFKIFKDNALMNEIDQQCLAIVFELLFALLTASMAAFYFLM